MFTQHSKTTTLHTLKCLMLFYTIINWHNPPRGASSRVFAQHYATSATTLLTNYDKLVSSSPLGEPVFRLQPPNVIEYPNTQGTTLVCLASGSPRPTISWYTSQHGLDRPVTNITNVRLILQDGAALRLLPFKESEFLQDVHTAEYRCVASNPIATINSKSISVLAGK